MSVGLRLHGPRVVCADGRGAAQARAFTLVELLVVIGIIAILVGILLPVLSMVRDNSRTTRCLANLGQIGQAFQHYANANHYYLPPADYYGQVDPLPNGGHFPLPGGGSWADILVWEHYLDAPEGYIQSGGQNKAGTDPTAGDYVLRCPSGEPMDVVSAGFPTSQTDRRGAMFFIRASDITLLAIGTWYAVNTANSQEANGLRPLPMKFLPDFYPPSSSTPGVMDWRMTKLTDLTNESTLPLVFDGVWMFANNANWINARHNGDQMTNILFADFHCETQYTNTLPNDNWYVH